MVGAGCGTAVGLLVATGTGVDAMAVAPAGRSMTKAVGDAVAVGNTSVGGALVGLVANCTGCAHAHSPRQPKPNKVRRFI